MEEEIVGSIQVRKGFYHSALLFATSERFIVAWVFHPKFRWRNLIPALPGVIAMLRKLRKLEGLSPDAILNDNADNFGISFSDVREVRIQGLLMQTIVLATTKAEHRFHMSRGERNYFEHHIQPHLVDKVPIR